MGSRESVVLGHLRRVLMGFNDYMTAELVTSDRSLEDDELEQTYCQSSVDGAKLPPGFCSHEVYTDMGKPRGIFITPANDILVLERLEGRVSLLKDVDNDLVADELIPLASAPSLNHGLSVHGEYIYASSSSTVYRWDASVIAAAQGQDSLESYVQQSELSKEIVIRDMNDLPCEDCGAPQGHSTRTLVFDDEGRLYISIGSVSNVDEDSYRAKIRRFTLDIIPDGGIAFADGEVFADGLRNEVGLTFDAFGVLWGVENGADNLYREDLGGDIHKDNPGEELNQFLEENKDRHYGYPYCFTEFTLPSKFERGRGAQWAHNAFEGKIIEGTNSSFDGQQVTDDFCTEEMVPAQLSMQAHSAPLGITFAKNLVRENGMDDEDCFGGFPASLQGDAFVGFHGSWNRIPPTGRKVVRIPFNAMGIPTGEQPSNLFCNDGSDIYFASGLKPVDLAFDRCGRLLVTSDGTGNEREGSKVFMITYFGPENISSFDHTVDCNSGLPGMNLIIVSAVVVGVVLLLCCLTWWSNRDLVERKTSKSEKK